MQETYLSAQQNAQRYGVHIGSIWRWPAILTIHSRNPFNFPQAAPAGRCRTLRHGNKKKQQQLNRVVMTPYPSEGTKGMSKK